MMTWLSGLLQRLISADNPESPKALVLYQSACGLLLVVLILTVACAIRIYRNEGLDGGSVTALVTAMGYLAALAGWHKQADPGHSETKPVPGTKEDEVIN